MAMDEETVGLDDLTALMEDQSASAENGKASLSPEPLFSALLRDVVQKLWPGDPVIQDFVAQVARPISEHLGHTAAKGGEFVARRRAEGKGDDEHFLYDQSMRAHLINGLFPVLHTARALQAWGAPQLRVYDEACRRIFIAGYVLHDYLKLPEVERRLNEAGFSHDRAVGPAQMPLLEELFTEWGRALGLDRFLEPIGGLAARLHDLIYIASNTQVRWSTLRNLSLLSRIQASPLQLDLAEQLSRLADLLAYAARRPQDAASDGSLHGVLTTLSGGLARLNYHHLNDNRGLLTNFIQNAALEAMSGEYRIPLLYAPSGVVYLEHSRQAPPLPGVETVVEACVNRIREAAGQALGRSLSGIKRDGKGMKWADYYWLFFDLPEFLRLGVGATFAVIHEGKQASAGKRFEKMKAGAWLGPEVDLDLPDDLRVDRLAEWCFLAEKASAARLPGWDAAGLLLELMGLEDLQAEFLSVPRDNRAGGVGYHWYFAAGHYLRRHPGLDPAAWQERVEGFASRLAGAAREAKPKGPDSLDSGWDDLRGYVRHTLTLGGSPGAGESRAAFALELHRYSSAKRRGRGTEQVCALCSSAYHIDKQQEAGVLFAPQVYSNKRPLHSTDAIRDICSICGMEMMLRQIFMNRAAASGGDFEGRRMRYLYFYPTYYFTPETLSLMRRVYSGLHRISFTDLRKQLAGREGRLDLSPGIFQRLEPLLLTPEDEIDPAGDRYLRMHFPETDPVTFYFMGVPPPGRKAKDAEAWVHPAFLALLLPLCLDVKVVASEASLPLMLEADEIAETVFLDSAHSAIGYLTGGQARINVDCLLPVLQRLTTAYLIHVDANSRMGSGGFDYSWQNLPALARDLSSSPLYAFHYLKVWQRRQNMDMLPPPKARLYLAYLDYLDRSKGGKEMSHAKELTNLYRRFYRARRNNSNSILRPVSIAARAVLEADPRLFDAEGLVEAVYGELRSFSERARIGNLAYYPTGSTRESREEAMRAFAAYFVQEIFFRVFRGDKSALRGKQLNLLKNACEVIYVDAAAQEREEKEAAAVATSKDAVEEEATEA